MKKIKLTPPINIGLVAGVVIILFGGWSVAMMGMIAGVLLGLILGPTYKKSTRQAAVKAIIPQALQSALIMFVISMFQNYLLAPAARMRMEYLDVVIIANLVGIILLISTACGLAYIFTLSDQPKTFSLGGVSFKLKPQATGIILMIALLVTVFPFFDQFTNLRWAAQIIFALMFVIMALGLNITVGFAGLLDLGSASFFAIGAYTTGILSSPQHGIHMNFWLVIWIAAAFASLWGLLVGAPTLRLRGDYLAIVTLGLGEIMPVLFKNLIAVTLKDPITCVILPIFMGANSPACVTFMENVDLTAGEKGINPIGRPWLPFIGEFQSSNLIPWYFLIIAIILLSVFLITRMRDSRLGRAWMAMREDELAASQMGIDITRTKLLAFMMAAMFYGLAGAFYASYITGIFPSVFDFSVSIIVLCSVILGGLGNVTGVIIGALVIMSADRLFLPALKDLLTGLLDQTVLPALASNPSLQSAVASNANPILYRYLLFGLTLVIMMAVRPEGLIPSEQRRREFHDEVDVEAVVSEKAA